MQHQQANIGAEFIDDRNMYTQQPGVYGIQLQGYPVAGQPIHPQYQQMQYGQPQQQQFYTQTAYVQYPQRIQNINQGFQQQVLVIPGSVVVAQPINPIVMKELALRTYSRKFYGCNCCFGLLVLIFLIIQCIASFNQGGTNVIAGIMYIISGSFFNLGVIFGLYSISRQVERILIHYQIFVGLALTFELIGSTITFASFSAKQEEIEDNNSSYQQSELENQQTITLIFFIASLVILIVCYGMILGYARQIRILMIDLNSARANSVQNINQQQGPVSNQVGF